MTGELPLGNGGGFGGYGLDVGGSPNNIIGEPGGRNVISGWGSGIRLGDSWGTTVQANYIGTNITGTAAIINYYYGVSILVDPPPPGTTTRSAGSPQLPVQGLGTSSPAELLTSGFCFTTRRLRMSPSRETSSAPTRPACTSCRAEPASGWVRFLVTVASRTSPSAAPPPAQET